MLQTADYNASDCIAYQHPRETFVMTKILQMPRGFVLERRYAKSWASSSVEAGAENRVEDERLGWGAY